MLNFTVSRQAYSTDRELITRLWSASLTYDGIHYIIESGEKLITAHPGHYIPTSCEIEISACQEKHKNIFIAMAMFQDLTARLTNIAVNLKGKYEG